MIGADDLLVCGTCATQFDVPFNSPLPNCRICDDPRQFVPPSGQKWTSMGEVKKEYSNKWTQDAVDEKLWSIETAPKFGIGQRAILLQTPDGNVLWDLIALLDEPTIEFIQSKGGLKAIVISHPHYYTTHIEWSKTFECPVYISQEDEEWVNRSEENGGHTKLITGHKETILPGITAIKTGGHFPGSLVLHYQNKLLIADTIVTVPSGLYFKDRPPGTTSYTFMWSIPNMIPLPPPEIARIWTAIQGYNFDTTHGAFSGMDIRDPNVKKRILDSMKIQVQGEGHEQNVFEDHIKARPV
ncbi:hypothetical protein M501DRAFT_997067 [Patellaria atrata CBS 101060]|uniref:Metallo-beta-lactamase domain-containing protein n=1 Tax=Patellaria atrata CBS 101060 TaxID=1346257 RepID=A0A9P4S772_9PEZI|nr:hypothetical protein M501DRAFT_997067 [Patellaria atrata CBS 101060]